MRVQTFSSDGELPQFKIGDILLVADEPLQERFREMLGKSLEGGDASEEDRMKNAIETAAKYCMTGQLVGRSDNQVKVGMLHEVNGTPIDPSVQWFDFDSIVAVMKRENNE